jgi:hypothetical protein
MMNDKEIKVFVRETLGCGCPEEVFQYMDYQSNIMSGDVLLRARINVGNRLLIYVVDVEKRESIRNILSRLIDIGKKERDDLGFNRFRLVLASDNMNEIRRTSEELFRDSGKDEKVHLHIVQKAVIPL